ncbi:nucleoside diphosphate kinase III, chloroplastic/mitochondrial-like [Juglans regia]|uniref:Nucleoside diphosphate kinase n=1 Tax=Juglans regia TaxID=51240 RepID=A0A2I4EY95_JUGRE|nr:nucleoside diphosphate kinase III, chloroplastic/mitochondrial-like [Juglans regia]
MDVSLGKIKVILDHFNASTTSLDSHQNRSSSVLQPLSDNSLRYRNWTQRSAAFMLNLFPVQGSPWGSSTDSQKKVELSAAEVESVRSELADLEERESHLKAQLEHVDEILRSARLSGYLFIRTRWTALPGEPPPLDDTDVDDWLPRFVVLHGPCIFFYLFSTDLSPQDSTLLSDIVEVGPLQSLMREDEETRYAFFMLTRQELRYECSSISKIQVESWLSVLQTDCKSSQMFRSASRASRLLLSAASKGSRLFSEGRTVAAAATVSLRETVPFLASNYWRAGSENTSRGWIQGALAIPAAAYMLQEQEAHAAELERTFIAIKPDGVQRGLISEIISRFEKKGFKLVAIKIVIPSKDFAQKHYHDLKERPFFNGLCDFLSSGPVIAMVWEGEGVIKYGRKLIGATDPQKSEPGTIRGDLAVVVGRNIIHGSDGPDTAKDEINLWFKSEELVSYTSNAEKWIYEDN